MPLEKNDIISSRSEEVQDILSRPSNVVERWGTIVFFMIIVSLLAAGAFVQYPDVINATMNITTRPEPVSLLARSNGKITEWYVTEKQKVNTNDVMGMIENTANYKHVLLLQKQLDSLNWWLLKDSIKPNVKNLIAGYTLGEIETAYAPFARALSDVIAFHEINYFDRKKEAIKKQIFMYKLYYDRVYSQKEILEQQLTIGEKQFARDSSLKSKDVIAQVNIEQSKIDLLQKEYAFHGSRTSLAQTNIQIEELNKNIADLDLQYYQTRAQLYAELKKNAELLKSAIAEWDKKFIVRSPQSGTATLFNYLSVNKNVRESDILMTVVPDSGGPVIGQMAIPIVGSAKVKTGQTVQVHIANYPAEEFGVLIGRVSAISVTPKDSVYFAEVEFPGGLITTYKKQLELKQHMKGTAEIITEEKTLLERIFNKFKYFFRNTQKPEVPSSKGKESKTLIIL